MAPSWIKTANVLPKFSSANPKKWSTNSRCPVEDTGMNSVNPSTTPRMVALMRSNSMRAYSAGQQGNFRSEAFEASAWPSQWGSPRHAQIATRLLAVLRLFYRVAAEFFIPIGAASWSARLHVDPVPARALPAFALRAPCARGARARSAAGRGARMGTTPGLPRAQPCGHDAGADRRRWLGGAGGGDHRRIPRRDPRRQPRRPSPVAARHFRPRRGAAASQLVQRQVLRRGQRAAGR